MKTFKQFLAEKKRKRAVSKLTLLFEYEQYKSIPGTASSYREDSPNSNTRTQRHSHIYAKLKGGGSELFAVNQDGSGHDGSSGVLVPATHADFLRSKGYKIPPDNILENLQISDLNDGNHALIFIDEVDNK